MVVVPVDIQVIAMVFLVDRVVVPDITDLLVVMDLNKLEHKQLPQ